MKITANTMRMSITSTTFETISSGTDGGVFHCDSLKYLTITGVTATDFFAPSSSSTTGGRFWYHSSSGIPLYISASTSTFTCSTTAFTVATM